MVVGEVGGWGGEWKGGSVVDNLTVKSENGNHDSIVALESLDDGSSRRVGRRWADGGPTG